LSHNSSLTGPTSTQRARDHANDLFSLNFKDEPWNYMYTVHSKTLKRCTFATDGHDPFIYDSDLGRYVPVEELVLSLSKGPEGEPALNPVETGARGAERGQE
jgi:hypothetical protein